MTTATDLIALALREGNLIPAGTAPTSVQLSEGLGRLNNLIKLLFGNEVGEQLFDWPVPPPAVVAANTARWPLYPGLSMEQVRLPSVYPYPPGNVRLMASNADALTVYMPAVPNDGARVGYASVGASTFLTLEGNGRLIDGAASVEVDPTAQSGVRLWFYRGDLGQWREVRTLGLADTPVLPEEFDDFLISGLAIRLSSFYGNDPRAGTVKTYTDTLRKLRARYRQPTPALGDSMAIPPTWQAFSPNYGDT